MSELSSWENVLLTDAGFFDPFDLNRPLTSIIHRFEQMLRKPFSETRVLFITAAVWDDESKHIAHVLMEELFWMGFSPENIDATELDKCIDINKAMTYDVMYFTGGWCAHLQQALKRTGFDATVLKFVYSNKVYVGMSAGSVIATPNIMGCFGNPDNPATEGLGLINAFIDCHCNLNTDTKAKKLSLPHIMLKSNQALAVSNCGYELIDELDARYAIDRSQPVKVFDLGKRTS